MKQRLIRLQAVCDRMGGVGKSLVYDMMAAGTLPRPIKLTPKLAVWLESEIDEIINVRIAGHDDDHVRALVTSLVAARAKAMPAAA